MKLYGRDGQPINEAHQKLFDIEMDWLMNERLHSLYHLPIVSNTYLCIKEATHGNLATLIPISLFLIHPNGTVSVKNSAMLNGFRYDGLTPEIFDTLYKQVKKRYKGNSIKHYTLACIPQNVPGIPSTLDHSRTLRNLLIDYLPRSLVLVNQGPLSSSVYLKQIRNGRVSQWNDHFQKTSAVGPFVINRKVHYLPHGCLPEHLDAIKFKETNKPEDMFLKEKDTHVYMDMGWCIYLVPNPNQKSELFKALSYINHPDYNWFNFIEAYQGSSTNTYANKL